MYRPLVPVTVRLYIPGAAVLLAEKVNTLTFCAGPPCMAPHVPAGFKEKLAVTPLGNGERVKGTVPEYPPSPAIERMTLADRPRKTVGDVGDASTDIPGPCVTVTGMVTDAVCAPDVPVIVID